MLPILLLFSAVVWVLTAQDVLRRRLSRGQKAAWIVATLVLPLLAIPAYWVVRPLPRRQALAVTPSKPSPQTLSDPIPGWTPDRADACEQADARARDESHPTPEPSFYAIRDQLRRLSPGAERAGSRGASA